MIAHSGHRRLWGALLAFLWFVGMVLLYYASHKPFSVEAAFTLVSAAWNLAVTALILSIAGGIGSWLVPAPDLHRLERVGLQAAAGCGVLSLGSLLLGALGFFRPWLVGLLLLLLFLGLLRCELRWWRDWRELGDLWRSGGRLGWGLRFLLLFLLGSTLATALAPPVKFDALVYHLALPRLYLQYGRLLYVPEIMYWGMPQAGESLYTLAMALGGENSAGAVLGWGIGVLALVGLAGYLAERFGARAAWVGVVTLLGGFSLAASLSWGYVEWFTILFGWAFLAALDRWRVSRTLPALFWAGAMAGMGMGVKYTAGLLILLGTLALAWYHRSEISELKLRAQNMWKDIAIFLGSAALFVMPWLVKNYLATGNPVYPLFFPAGAMDRFRLDLYQNGSPWGDWADVLFLPLRITYLGFENAPGYSAAIGPLLFGLGGASIFAWAMLSQKRQATLEHAALLAVPGLVIWATAGRFTGYLLQARLYFEFFPALATLAAAGYAGLARQAWYSVRFGKLAAFMVLLVMGLNTFEVGVQTLAQGSLQYLVGLRTLDSYLADNLGWFAPAMQAVRSLPPESRVLMLWEPRSLYCLPRCEPDEVLDRWAHDISIHGGSDPSSVVALLKDWRASGFTHLLYSRQGAEFIRQESGSGSPESWQALDYLLALLPGPEEFGDAYALYKLVP